jgi:hypothetical protein
MKSLRETNQQAKEGVLSFAEFNAAINDILDERDFIPATETVKLEAMKTPVLGQVKEEVDEDR